MNETRFDQAVKQENEKEDLTRELLESSMALAMEIAERGSCDGASLTEAEKHFTTAIAKFMILGMITKLKG